MSKLSPENASLSWAGLIAKAKKEIPPKDSFENILKEKALSKKNKQLWIAINARDDQSFLALINSGAMIKNNSEIIKVVRIGTPLMIEKILEDQKISVKKQSDFWQAALHRIKDRPEVFEVLSKVGFALNENLFVQLWSSGSSATIEWVSRGLPVIPEKWSQNLDFYFEQVLSSILNLDKDPMRNPDDSADADQKRKSTIDESFSKLDFFLDKVQKYSPLGQKIMEDLGGSSLISTLWARSLHEFNPYFYQDQDDRPFKNVMDIFLRYGLHPCDLYSPMSSRKSWAMEAAMLNDERTFSFLVSDPIQLEFFKSDIKNDPLSCFWGSLNGEVFPELALIEAYKTDFDFSQTDSYGRTVFHTWFSRIKSASPSFEIKKNMAEILLSNLHLITSVKDRQNQTPLDVLNSKNGFSSRPFMASLGDEVFPVIELGVFLEKNCLKKIPKSKKKPIEKLRL